MESRNLKDCAKRLNDIAKFKVIDSKIGNGHVWVNWKEYSLMYELKGELK